MVDDIHVEFITHNNQISYKQSQELQNEKKLALLKEITAEVFSNSTMHGLSRIITAKSWIIKFIWITFLISSIGWFVSYSIQSLYDFWAYKVTTEIRTIYETPTIFPTITICNSRLFVNFH
jgi:hypothetical protein